MADGYGMVKSGRFPGELQYELDKGTFNGYTLLNKCFRRFWMLSVFVTEKIAK